MSKQAIGAGKRGGRSRRLDARGQQAMGSRQMRERQKVAGGADEQGRQDWCS